MRKMQDQIVDLQIEGGRPDKWRDQMVDVDTNCNSPLKGGDIPKRQGIIVLFQRRFQARRLCSNGKVPLARTAFPLEVACADG